MNVPETINIEKYAEALNNLVGMDIGYLGDSDENVNAIVEVINAAKVLERTSEEWESKYFQQVAEVQGMLEMILEIFEEIEKKIDLYLWGSSELLNGKGDRYHSHIMLLSMQRGYAD